MKKRLLLNGMIILNLLLAPSVYAQSEHSAEPEAPGSNVPVSTIPRTSPYMGKTDSEKILIQLAPGSTLTIKNAIKLIPAGTGFNLPITATDQERISFISSHIPSNVSPVSNKCALQFVGVPECSLSVINDKMYDVSGKGTRIILGEALGPVTGAYGGNGITRKGVGVWDDTSVTTKNKIYDRFSCYRVDYQCEYILKNKVCAPDVAKCIEVPSVIGEDNNPKLERRPATVADLEWLFALKSVKQNFSFKPNLKPGH